MHAILTHNIFRCRLCYRELFRGKTYILRHKHKKAQLHRKDSGTSAAHQNLDLFRVAILNLYSTSLEIERCLVYSYLLQPFTRT